MLWICKNVLKREHRNLIKKERKNSLLVNPGEEGQNEIVEHKRRFFIELERIKKLARQLILTHKSVLSLFLNTKTIPGMGGSEGRGFLHQECTIGQIQLRDPAFSFQEK